MGEASVRGGNDYGIAKDMDPGHGEKPDFIGIAKTDIVGIAKGHITSAT
jgi:hypothetical protein